MPWTENTMATKPLSEFVNDHYFEVVEHYVLNNESLETMANGLGERHGIKASTKMWGEAVRSAGIFKYIRLEEAIRIAEEQRYRGIAPRSWKLLAVAGGFLIDINGAREFRKRTKRQTDPSANPTKQRQLVFIPLPFDYRTLEDPREFTFVKRMLWLATVEIESCFAQGIWKADGRGLYNRSQDLRSDLSELSRFHNGIMDAIRCCELGQYQEGEILNCFGCGSLDRIVLTTHHRRTPDLLAVIRLIKKKLPNKQASNSKSIHEVLCDVLRARAMNLGLAENDPRRRQIEAFHGPLLDREWDCEGHFLVTYDTYCRRLWMEKVKKIAEPEEEAKLREHTSQENHRPAKGGELATEIKAYVSYNQASFPRADPGQFYHLFSGKSLGQIEVILAEADRILGRLTTEAFTLWHTAFNYLFQEEKFEDAESVATRLVQRIQEYDEHEVSHNGQANHDAAQTFRLQGRAREEQNKFPQALRSFEAALEMRRKRISTYTWDPLLKSILVSLEKVGGLLGLATAVEDWGLQLQAMTLAVARHA